MDENKKKNRREWVKTAAIVFLSVMLVLTFFSNTFMNYSLPEVAGQSAMSGSITAKIRGTGVVESGDPYNVMVKQVRTVSSIEVKVGDVVQKGDVLIILTDEESEELKAAQKALEDAEDAYDQALLNAEVTTQVVSQSKANTSTTTYRNQITAAQKAVKDAEKAVEAAQDSYDEAAKKISDLETQISVLQARVTDADAEEQKAALEEAKKNLEDAKLAKQQAELNVSSVENWMSQHTVSDNDYAAYAAYKKRYENEVGNAQVNIEACELRVAQAQAVYDRKVAEADPTGEVASLTYQKTLLGVDLNEKDNALTKKKEELAKKTEALTELTGDISKALGLENLFDAIEDARKNYEKAQSQAVDSKVTAGVSGKITAINVASGKDTNTVDPAVVIQPEGKGYSLSFSVTNDQAKKLSAGIQADLVNAWRYDDVTAVLSSIRPDQTDPGQKKLLTFDVSGNVTPGQSLSLSVGDKSANYDAIVPNSAIREDNNGKFVLVVESKQSPLGTRYVATRMDVQVLASDDTQTAVSGLYGYEFVITTSTKPVEAGQLVRLTD